jgi:hypothetical protein
MDAFEKAGLTEEQQQVLRLALQTSFAPSPLQDFAIAVLRTLSKKTELQLTEEEWQALRKTAETGFLSLEELLDILIQERSRIEYSSRETLDVQPPDASRITEAIIEERKPQRRNPDIFTVPAFSADMAAKQYLIRRQRRK